MSGTVDEFWESRPKLTHIERKMLNAYKCCRREVPPDLVVKLDDLRSALSGIEIEADCGVLIMQRVDDHYRHLYTKEIKRKSKR